MSHFLLPTTPLYGHVTPMLTIGRGLRAAGHRVTVLTGRKYRADVEASGLTYLPLPAAIDYDDADLDAWLPDRHRHRGVAAGRHDIIGMFVRPLPLQHRALSEALAAERYDAVLCEAAFLGVLPLLLSHPAGQRIPVVGVSVTPLSVTSVDCAPFGSGLDPGSSAHTRRRNRFINAVLRSGPLKPIRTSLDAALAEVDAPRSTRSYFDQVTMFDLTFQLAVAGLEYPRRELPSSVRFVGPLRPEVGSDVVLPGWWGDLDRGRPVVHVTQGTMANSDFRQLLLPTLRGLASEDVLVVASTGRRPVGDLLSLIGGPPPDNLRLATFLPYASLLPRTHVMVSNGGFGGVQQALSYGLPLVVAGASEDKPEVAARVAWAGAGVNLRTGAPSPAQVRRGVRRVLREGRFRQAARRLQDEIARQPDPVEVIVETLEQLVSAPGRPTPLTTSLGTKH
jgi:UDP:flavonoid glycosyltransferase YjiC (YdhE family)